jgi:hypothetical protein
MTIRASVCFALVTALLAVAAPCAPEAVPEPTPNLESQAAIERLVATINEAQGGGPGDSIPAMAEQLRRRVTDRGDSLLLQLVLYMAAHPGNETAMGSALLIDYYGFADEEKAAVLTPHVASDDDRLRDTVLETLSTVKQPPEIRENVERMQAIEPLLVGSRAATSAELDQARDRIDSLSREDAWWVRMYAARAVRIYPELGSSELVGRLRTDEDPRVREAAAKQPASGHLSTRPD